MNGDVCVASVCLLLAVLMVITRPPIQIVAAMTLAALAVVAGYHAWRRRA